MGLHAGSAGKADPVEPAMRTAEIECCAVGLRLCAVGTTGILDSTVGTTASTLSCSKQTTVYLALLFFGERFTQTLNFFHNKKH
jgi:hypothetical protein